MKKFLIVGICVLLGACTAAPMVQTSINGNSFSSGPTSARDPRLQRPQFYMDEGDAMPWLKADAPRTNQ